MTTTTSIIVALVAAWVAFSAYAIFTRKSWVVDNLADYGVPRSWWPWLGTAKALGSAGLVAGIWWPPLGLAAACGLVLYFTGAVITVLRARACAHVPFPLLYLAPVVVAGVLIAFR
ncbi:DoxX family protein [Nocardioides jensenii]|uniref:DoxX family protein n=1 Tax=Nocardioides jensenii TaxID=1843 RepID=UPI000836381F|nr:DoxX family protein [Nocardioides jensenii]